MKRLVCLLSAVVLSAAAALAQPIAPDPAFRVGRLDNGMTYYLYHNENPPGCAEFYIAHHVGALQEEDNQNGLAHFLEHMAFNGTKHYPGKGLLEFLAKDGVRFGYNVNAYTSRNETVYNISAVPLVRDSFVDSVLLILHDWSCDISCEQQALDDERGVISEEWRLRDEPRYHMMMLQNGLIYKGSKQPERTVIGTLEVINGFKREEILDFYHKWYRPDLQAIIVVGDFDVDYMEGKVRKAFSDIPKVQNPTPKERYFPPRLEEPLFEDMTDNRVRFNALKIIYKQPYPDLQGRIDESYIKDWFCRQIVSAALADRLKKAAQEKSSPARSAVLVTSEYEPDFFISLFTVTPKNKNLLAKSLEFTHREINRMVRFGLSPSEFEVAKLSSAQRYRLDRTVSREELKSEDLVRSALQHFLNNHPLVTPVELMDIQKRILAGISYEDIKPYPAMMFSESEVIYSTCYNPEEEPGIAPSAEQMKAILAAVDAEELEPGFLEYKGVDMSVNLPSGSIVKRSKVKDYEEWTLSNGVKVYYRQAPAVTSNDHLVMHWRFGTGFRSYPEDKVTPSRIACSWLQRSLGFRDIERSDFKGHPELGGISSLISSGHMAASLEFLAGAGRQEDAFRMACLLLTEPYFGTEQMLEQYKENTLKSLSRQKSKRLLFEEKCLKQVNGDHPWQQVIDSAAVQAVNMDLVKEVYKRLYTDFGSLKLFITSDLDRSEIETLVCRYAAGLTGEYGYAKARTAYPRPVLKGYNLIREQNEPQSEPLTVINYHFVNDIKATTRNLVTDQLLDYIMSARYNNLIREERGGTYHVGFGTSIPDNPALPWQGEVDFQTRPEMETMLLGDVKAVMDDMCSKGPTAQEMELACKYLAKRHGEVEKRVSQSLRLQHRRLMETVLYGREYGYDYQAVLSSIKPSHVRSLARKLRSGATIVEVYTEN